MRSHNVWIESTDVTQELTKVLESNEFLESSKGELIREIIRLRSELAEEKEARKYSDLANQQHMGYMKEYESRIGRLQSEVSGRGGTIASSQVSDALERVLDVHHHYGPYMLTGDRLCSCRACERYCKGRIGAMNSSRSCKEG